jgi:hypothetical protein
MFTGYLAHHRCSKCHIIFCVEGSIETDLENKLLFTYFSFASIQKLLMRKGFLYLLCSFTALNVSAQTNSNTDWAVLNSGDTIKGTIKHQRWSGTPTSIEFQSGAITIYTTKDLKAFSTQGEIYQRFTTRRHPLPIYETEQLPENEDSLIMSTDWLKMLVQARYGLAELRTPERPYYFLVDGSEAVELVYYRGIRPGGAASIQMNTFRNQLNDIAQKTGNTHVYSADLSYMDSELSDYMYKLNHIEKKTVSNMQYSWFVRAGVAFNSYTLQMSQTFGGFSPGTAKSSISPIAGIGYMIVPLRHRGLGLMMDLGLNNIQTTGTGKNSSTSTSRVEINTLYTELSLAPVYVFTKPAAVRFYAGLGIKLLTAISSNNSTTITNDLTGTATETKYKTTSGLIAPIYPTLGILSNRMIFSVGYSSIRVRVENRLYNLIANNFLVSAAFSLSR